MPKPLHNRVDSMLEIEFDIDEWATWALETNPLTGKLRIHPTVFSFCYAHPDKVMFSQYDPENVTSKFLTPRTWEQVSKVIYAAEARGGVRNKASFGRIQSVLGGQKIKAVDEQTIAEIFYEHYTKPFIVEMDKIKNGEYTAYDFPSIEDKYYALGIIISEYDGDEITIESFICECLGDEFLSVYQSMKKHRNNVLKAASETVTVSAPVR